MSNIHAKLIGKQQLFPTISQINVGTDDIPIRPLHHAIGIIVTESQPVTHGIITPVNINVVTMIEYGTERFVHPISINTPLHLG